MAEKVLQCAIIVSSCDAYSDAWGPFFTLFFRYWPDCPFPIYLVTNSKSYPDGRVRSIHVLEYHDWGRKLKLALNKIPQNHILYLQEDYFLKRTVNTNLIRSLAGIMQTENTAYLRLYPSPGPTRAFKDYATIGIIDAQAPYRTSLQAAIWDKDVFVSLLSDTEEGAAAFEKRTSGLSANAGRLFLSVRRGKLFPYDRSAAIDYLSTGIVKGRWHLGTVRLFKKESIVADWSRRPFEARSECVTHTLTRIPFVGKAFRLAFRVAYKIEHQR